MKTIKASVLCWLVSAGMMAQPLTANAGMFDWFKIWRVAAATSTKSRSIATAQSRWNWVNQAKAEVAVTRGQTQIPNTLKAQFREVNNPSVVYLRENPYNKGVYVGRSKNTLTFLKRQAAHNWALNTKHNFSILGVAGPQTGRKATSQLRTMEESAMRFIRRSRNTSDHVENKNVAMKAKEYKEKLGHMPMYEGNLRTQPLPAPKPVAKPLPPPPPKPQIVAKASGPKPSPPPPPPHPLPKK